MNEAVAQYKTARSSALDLEFPDWSGMERCPPTASMEKIHKLSLSLQSRIPSSPDLEEQRLKDKVSVEFEL